MTTERRQAFGEAERRAALIARRRITGAPARVGVLELDPDLADALSAADLAEARRVAHAPVRSLKAGPWEPASLARAPGDLGLLVLDGLLARDVAVAGSDFTELIGAGDLLPPADIAPDEGALPLSVSWTVIEPTRVALLDRRFAGAIGRWPELTAALLERASRRSVRLAGHQAICHLTRVDSRLLLLFWELADRWGRVTADGVVLPLRLPHRTLGRLVGAQRPSVTKALKELAQRGLVTRRADGSWLLTELPPEEVGGAVERATAVRPGAIGWVTATNGGGVRSSN
jgi:CRP/FNR family transcriptional regulator, cyclic AMP receptor protein